MRQTSIASIAAAVLVAAVRLLTLPRGYWHADEIRFAQALLTFDPLRQQPELPANPLYVALGRLVNFFVRDPFIALVVLSVIGSVAAAVLIVRLTTKLLGDAWLGVAAAVVVLFSPALLVYGPLPSSDSVTIAIVAAAFLFLAEKRPELFALATAAAIGVRPEIAPAMIVVFIFGCAVLPRRIRSVAVFGAIVVMTFAPVVDAVGWRGMGEWIDIRSGGYRAALLRVVAHPWGGKLLSIPVIAAAGAGMAIALRRHRQSAFVVLALFGAIHLAWAIVAGDPGSAVQPAIPALLVVGFFAVAAFASWPRAAGALTVLFAAASFAYVWPILEQRTTGDAPARAAVKHAARTLQPGSIVVAHPDLAPFAGAARGRFAVVTPERFDAIARSSSTDVYLLMHGRSDADDAQTFEWADSDAYGKLTTEKFRVVSLVPQPPARRYIAHSGVYLHESSPERGEWRWVAREAVIELPQVGAKWVALRLRLPDDAAIAGNRVHIGPETHRYIERGRSVHVIVAAKPLLRIVSQSSFTPGEGRDLAVQIISAEQR